MGRIPTRSANISGLDGGAPEKCSEGRNLPEGKIRARSDPGDGWQVPRQAVAGKAQKVRFYHMIVF